MSETKAIYRYSREEAVRCNEEQSVGIVMQ